MRRGHSIVLASMLVAAAPCSAAPAQSVPGPTQTLKVYSRETIVDVIVTDAQGKPVLGLPQEAFTVKENGRPQPIRSFAEYSAEVSTPAPARRLPAGVYTNFQPVPPAGPLDVLLIDALNSPGSLVYARQGILDYLGQRHAGAQTAVFWLTATGLHLAQGFTADRTLLIKAASGVRTDIGYPGPAWMRQKLTTDSMIQLAQYVSTVKGRKNMLWFTAGMPVLLMRDGGLSWGLDGKSQDMTSVHRNMDAYEMLTAAQVAVYPIDPRGPEAGMGNATLEAEKVAEDSGGAAFYNNNDVGGLIAKAVDHGSRFYTLSYIPPKLTDDGHYHRISVEVDRPRLHLVYRQGYNAEPLPVHAAPPGPQFMKAAMEGTAPPASQIVFDARVTPALPAGLATTLDATADPFAAAAAVASSAHGAATPAKGARPTAALVRYDIVFAVPQSQIAFLDGPNGSHQGSVEFDAVAYDGMRRRVALLSQTVKMPVSAEAWDGFVQAPLKFTQHLDLPPGQLTLRVGVLDNVSHNVGTIEVPLNVGAALLTQDPNATPCPPRCALPSPTLPERPR